MPTGLPGLPPTLIERVALKIIGLYPLRFAAPGKQPAMLQGRVQDGMDGFVGLGLRGTGPSPSPAAQIEQMVAIIHNRDGFVMAVNILQLDRLCNRILTLISRERITELVWSKSGIHPAARRRSRPESAHRDTQPSAWALVRIPAQLLQNLGVKQGTRVS